jgi:uncharacterized protein involved in exopolysaccharide biosynthesis
MPQIQKLIDCEQKDSDREAMARDLQNELTALRQERQQMDEGATRRDRDQQDQINSLRRRCEQLEFERQDFGSGVC